MSNTKTILALSILILSSLACNALVPQTETPPQFQQPSSNGALPASEDEVPRVSVEDAKIAFDSGEAIIVDVRSRASYNDAHMIDALSIPLDLFESNIGNIDLPKDKWIITYCT